MKRVLYLLLFLAACKSSSSDKEVDRATSVIEQILNEDISTAFRPETFEGDISHISEVTYSETSAGDGYVNKDTVLKEYLFKDHRLHQIATVTRRMRNDTLTIRYDTAGRILALIYSDNQSTYNTDRFKYDATGRRIEKTNRFYSTESRHLYTYNPKGDTLLITWEPDNNKEQICISKDGNETTVTRHALNSALMSRSQVEKYNGLNQVVGIYVYEDGKADYKVIKKYDSHGNLLSWEQHQGDHMTENGFGEVDKMISYATEYAYDEKGNWTSMKKQVQDKGWTATTTRKIIYR